MLHYIRVERLSKDKHPTLLGPCVSYDENEVFWLRSLNLLTKSCLQWKCFKDPSLCGLHYKHITIIMIITDATVCSLYQGILKGTLYHWPPVWLVWNQLYDYWQFLFLFAKQTIPNLSNRRSTVLWYFPYSIPCLYFKHNRSLNDVSRSVIDDSRATLQIVASLLLL